MGGIFKNSLHCTYVDCAQQQQRGAQAQGVNGAQDEGNQDEEDALWLG